MQLQAHSLEPFFYQAVRNSYEERLGLDPEITAYVSRMLCDFAEPGNRYRMCDLNGFRIENLQEMVRAADPVHGIAKSFIQERICRQYIGDYALFLAGMCPDEIEADSNTSGRPTLAELIRVGKESYYIVSQFNVFEYEHEAPLFGRLFNVFEHCILGLAIARRELWRTINPPAPVK